MKTVLFFFLVFGGCTFAQKGTWKRSDGDLLSGTWRCVDCRDTTITTLTFEDTLFRMIAITPDGLKTTACPFKMKRNKVFIHCDDRHWKYKVISIDYNSLELYDRKKGILELKKTAA